MKGEKMDKTPSIEVIRWVTEHGGIECIEKRLMPKGYEWPRFEDGTRVKFGDVVSDGDETGRVYYVTFDAVNPVIIGFTDETPDQDPGTWLEVSVNDGERVNRPAPKVLDADGAEIRVGDVLYRKSDGRMVKVAEVYEKTFTDADNYVRPGDGFCAWGQRRDDAD